MSVERDAAIQAAYEMHITAVNAAHRRRYDAETRHVAEVEAANAAWRQALADINREFREGR